VAGRPYAVRTLTWSAEDGSVTTEQRIRLERPAVPRTRLGALALGRIYWDEVERALPGLVQVRREPSGPAVRLGRRGPVLLRFGRAEPHAGAGRVACRFPIAGGLLARRPGGSLVLAQTEREALELRSTVSGFHPRLAARPGLPRWTGALYARIQARLHDAIGRRYLARLAERPLR
jgi:hypothetical protein